MPTSKEVKKYKRNGTKLKTRSKANGGGNLPRPLSPYEFTFCEWLARHPEHPKVKEQVAKLREMLNPPDKDGNPPEYIIPVDRKKLVKLKNRQEFKDYFAEMRKEELGRARSMFIKRMPNAVAGHFDALDQVLANGDYRAVPSFTVPVLDRVMPKKAENAPVTAIKIELSQAQQDLLELPEASVEVVEITEDES